MVGGNVPIKEIIFLEHHKNPKPNYMQPELW